MQNCVIGIDEVGRGPLAGPVAVGVAAVRDAFDWQQLPGVTDSKQLTEAKRETIYTQAQQLQRAGVLHYEVAMVSAKVIDRVGIVAAINLAMQRALARLESKPHILSFKRKDGEVSFSVKLDGGLRAPTYYRNQETIIKGDSLEPVIGLASIVAKVRRDRYLCRLAKRPPYQPYHFHTHKGYGTAQHRAAIAQCGLSDQHRQSYCKNIKML